jgi:predicted membrane metal-binding protein
VIWLYIVVASAGVILSLRLARSRAPRTWLAIVGTALALVAILTGFSLGIYFGVVAAFVLMLAARDLHVKKRAS